MRIVAAADLHLGAGSDYGREPGARLEDQRNSWAHACSFAIEEKADLFLFAGDAFHRPRPSPAELLAFRSGLDLLREAGIPLLAITGNHDVSSATPGAPNALSIFDKRGAMVEAAPRVVRVGDVCIACLPWTPLGRFQSGKEGDRDAVRQHAAEALIEVAAGLLAECDTPHPILMSHWTIGGCRTPSGQTTDTFRDVILNRTALGALGFGQIVAGHIHQPQGITDNGYYCGSLATVDFGEEHVTHGVVLIDSTKDGYASRFFPIADRPFVTLGLEDIGVTDVSEAVVRVRYSGLPEEIARTDHAAIRRRLLEAGAHHVYSIAATVERQDRARVEGVEETIGPLDGLQAWVDHQKIPVVQAQKMRTRTERYLGDLP